MLSTWVDSFFKGIYKLFLLLLFPVLFCIYIIGYKMNYCEGLKMAILLPNQILFVIALLGLVVCLGLLIWGKRFELTPKRNWIINILLAVGFLLLFFFNVMISKEITFYLPYDVMVVREGAYHVHSQRPLGYQAYYSMYPNNIPIMYLLGRLRRWASEFKNYAYPTDFFWTQVGCGLVSVAGFFSVMLIKKITRNVIAVLVNFLLFFQLVAMSAWKMVPYTDTYGICFGVMAIYFYVSYRVTKKNWAKHTYMVLSVLSVAVGGVIKPSLYVILIAMVGVEFLFLLKNFKENWKYFLVQILLAGLLFAGSKLYLNYVIDEIGLEFNPVVSATWHHYFAMGLNEETTGGYNSYYVALFGQHQFSKEDRIAAEIDEIKRSYSDRGFIGSLYFYLRKLVMTFNDGQFGWKTEVWADRYMDGIAGNNGFMEFLRGVYWDGPYVGRYNTLCQLLWLFSMLGFPGICLSQKNKETPPILVVSFLGIFFYQMFFEARARYLFVFLPLLLSMCVYGFYQYSCVLEPFALKVWSKVQKKLKIANTVLMATPDMKEISQDFSDVEAK